MDAPHLPRGQAHNAGPSAQPDQGTVLPASGMAQIGLGELLCEWNDLEEAIRILPEGIQLLRGTSESGALVRGDVALVRAYWAQGNSERALETLQQGDEWLIQSQISSQDGRAWWAAHRVRLAIWQGDLASALAWAASVSPGKQRWIGYVEQFSLLRVGLAQYGSNPQTRLLSEAAQGLPALLAAAEAREWLSFCIEGAMLLALIHQAQRSLNP